MKKLLITALIGLSIVNPGQSVVTPQECGQLNANRALAQQNNAAKLAECDQLIGNWVQELSGIMATPADPNHLDTQAIGFARRIQGLVNLFGANPDVRAQMNIRNVREERAEFVQEIRMDRARALIGSLTEANAQNLPAIGNRLANWRDQYNRANNRIEFAERLLSDWLREH